MSINNIVATASLRITPDLRGIFDMLQCNERFCCWKSKPDRKALDAVLCNGRNACWRNRAFGSINVKLGKKTLFQIFQNGRVIIIGGVTEAETKENFARYLSILFDLGISNDCDSYRIQNIVATYDYKRRLDLFYIAKKNRLQFEPELFPAVRYRIHDLKITVNIFHTGKCTILGAKTVVAVSQAVERIKKLLRTCRKLTLALASSAHSGAW